MVDTFFKANIIFIYRRFVFESKDILSVSDKYNLSSFLILLFLSLYNQINTRLLFLIFFLKLFFYWVYYEISLGILISIYILRSSEINI